MTRNVKKPSTSWYRFGDPLPTGATVKRPTPKPKSASSLASRFSYRDLESEGILLQRPLALEEACYGLGAKVAPINRKGKEYRFFASEPPSQIPPLRTSYGSLPFLIIHGDRSEGIFINSGAEIFMDVGAASADSLTIRVAARDFDVYVFTGSNPLDIVREFLTLTGMPYLPPKWAFGYHQSRWSYPDQDTVEFVAEKLSKHRIPCDSIHLDIDHMENFKVFTVDEKKFPDLPRLSRELLDQGIKLVSIVDPGVRIEPGYDVYEEGLKNNYFCGYREGGVFSGAVWPGMCHFPDFLQPEVQRWWGRQYGRLLDQGIAGFWNDMNEPTIFFSPDSLRSFRNKFERALSADTSGEELARLVFQRNPLSFREVGYANLIHRLDDKSVPHTEVHNLYGALMTRSAAEGLKERLGNKRVFLLSRSSFVGMHRYATVWMGDNSSWWEHLLLHIRMLVSLNMGGYFFTGADIGGFWGDATGELVARWTALGVFTPFFRNHSSEGSRAQEPWAFDETVLRATRGLIELRYRLIPFIYSAFLTARQRLEPLCRPLSFDFDDSHTNQIDDQFMFGNGLLVAPVISPNNSGRWVYLPVSTNWLLGAASSEWDSEFRVVSPGMHYVDAALHQLPIAIKSNSVLTLAPVSRFVDEQPIEALTVFGFVESEAHYTMLNDDGMLIPDDNVRPSSLEISLWRDTSATHGYRVTLTYTNNSQNLPHPKRVQFQIYDETGTVHSFTEQLIEKVAS